MTASQEARRRAMKAIRWYRKHGPPTVFNPHYVFKGRSLEDDELSSRMGNTKRSRGPQFKTVQWEATARVIGLNTTARDNARVEALSLLLAQNKAT